MTPFVAGDHGVACATMTPWDGLSSVRDEPICVQPMPKSPQLSRWELLSPIAASRSLVQLLARIIAGEPVSRGPISSKRALEYSITCECRKPSSRIRAYISRSIDSTACAAFAAGISVAEFFFCAEAD